MARRNKAALVLNNNGWALRLAIRRAEEIGARPPYEESSHRGFMVQVPNPSDVLAWVLDEVGRQGGELANEAQCWQDAGSKKKQVEWVDNAVQLVENINDCLMVSKQLILSGVKLPETYPWNPEGVPESTVDVSELMEEVQAEITAELDSSVPDVA